jgi:hypothetical protein
VLLNGEIAAGKINKTRSMLQRINADQVKCIEVMRGTSGELDVRGSRQVINVVLIEQISNAS